DGIRDFHVTGVQTCALPICVIVPAGTRSRLLDTSLLKGPVGLLAASGILRAMAFITFTNGMPLYLSVTRGFAPDAQVIGLTLSLYSISSATGSVLAGFVEPRVGRIVLVSGSMLLALPFLAAVLLVDAGGAVFYLCVMMAGFFTNLSIPMLVVSAQDLAPDSVAAASGLLMGFTWGVAGVVYIAFGALQEVIGLQSANAIGFSFLIPAAAVAAYVLRRHSAAIEAAR